METTIEEILKRVEENIEKPLVTARFGDNWKVFQKRMVAEGQLSIDDILDIAYINGRKAILLEMEITKLLN